MAISKHELEEHIKTLEFKFMFNAHPIDTKPYYDHIVKECLRTGLYKQYNSTFQYYETLEYLFKSNVMSRFTTAPILKPREENNTNFCYIKE